MHDNLLQAPNYKPRLSAGEHTKMCADKHQIVSIDINAQQEQLLTIASKAHARRAGRTLYHGDGLRQTMVALLSGAELAEHESPLEAFLYVLKGRITIHGHRRKWEVSAGEQIPIPPERHSVTAVTDSVITLTVLRDVSGLRS